MFLLLFLHLNQITAMHSGRNDNGDSVYDGNSDNGNNSE